MKFTHIFFITCITLVAFEYAHALSNAIYFQDTGPFSTTAPGFNSTEPDPKFNNVQPILFTPDEDAITGDDSDKNKVGYFWDVKDTDTDLQFPGKARIGNSQYINVVAVPANQVNTTGDSDSVISSSSEDIYHPSSAEKKKFDPQYLVKIGTFMKKNNPTVFVLFGRYLSTVFPDPRNTQIIGQDDTIPQS